MRYFNHDITGDILLKRRLDIQLTIKRTRENIKGLNDYEQELRSDLVEVERLISQHEGRQA